MIVKVFVIFMIIGAALCKPQLLTLKDGKIGVNFGGYHAEAGLGGILTGNSAHGGLSASAGTPLGQRAAAGIGGSIDGRTLGGAYAGAEAGNGYGASAGLGGSVGGGGALGAESHRGGLRTSVIKTISSNRNQYSNEPTATGTAGAVVQNSNLNVIQKVKPPKKYVEIAADNHVIATRPVVSLSSSSSSSTPSIIPKQYATGYNHYIIESQQQPQVVVYRKRFRPLRRRLHFRKHFIPIIYQPVQHQEVIVEKHREIVQEQPPPPPPSVQVVKRKHFFTAPSSINGGSFFDSIFNIPISTLRAVNGFLNQGFGGGVGVQKSVEVHAT